MIMLNDSLTRFANTLYAEAAEERARTEERLKAERDEVFAKVDAEIKNKIEREIKRIKRKTEFEKQLVVSKREVEAVTKLRRKRQEIADSVMSEVKDMLYSFVTEDRYITYLEQKTKEVEKSFNRGNTVCILRECDIDKVKAILKIENVVFEPTDEDIIGGFILRNEELGIFADCTLRNGFEDGKELFLEISRLIIE